MHSVSVREDDDGVRCHRAMCLKQANKACLHRTETERYYNLGSHTTTQRLPTCQQPYSETTANDSLDSLLENTIKF